MDLNGCPSGFTATHLAGPALVANADNFIVWANDAFCRLLGADPVSVVGAPAAAVLDEPVETVSETVARYLVRDASGRRLWLQCCASQWEEPAAGVLTLRWFVDITEFESRNRSRAAALSGRDASRLDAATGALNRLTILQELEGEITRSRRYGNPLSAILIRLSEGAGPVDSLIQAVLGRINYSLRWVDSIGRLSGRELLVLLPETDLDGAQKVMYKFEQDSGPGQPETDQVALAWNGSDSTEKYLDRMRDEWPTFKPAA